jgi:hypothetical protein
LDREAAPRTDKSTLYNPVRRGQVDITKYNLEKIII